MKSFHGLLQHGASFKELLKYLPAIIFVQIILTLLGYELVTGTNLEHYLRNNSYVLSLYIATAGIGNYLRSFLVVAPISEEIQFRLIPFVIVFLSLRAMRLEGRTVGMWVLMATLFLTSIVFGLAHGSFRNIFMQGVSGVVYGLVFLKWRGLTQARYVDRIKNTAKGLLASTIVHSSFNGSLLFMATCGSFVFR
jgi:hypothetical protein